MLDVPKRSNHTADAELLDTVRELAEQQPYGHSLIQDFYISQEIYRLDIERMMFKHWLCVGHESSIKEKGQYFVCVATVAPGYAMNGKAIPNPAS